MFDALPTPDEMRAWDNAAINDYGIREEILMENASREAFHTLMQWSEGLYGKRLLFFMGGGNNGGDAACLARHCLDAGADVLVLHTKARNTYKGAAGYHVRLAARTGVAFKRLTPATLEAHDEIPYDIIVDGLLGTGFAGDLRDDYLDYVRWINSRAALSRIFAIDIPSGLNGLTGHPRPEAVYAHATVSFEAAKVGLCMSGASAYTGQLFVRPIGIPAFVREDYPAQCFLLGDEVGCFIPTSSADMHKGTAGHTVIVGGSQGLSGAAVLAARGALRGGSGYVTVACPAAIAPEIKYGNPDILTHPIGSSSDWDPASFAKLEPLLARASALVIGPGMGRSNTAGAFIEWLLSAERPPAVIDADALWWLSERKSLISQIREHDILTPHPAELARLLKTDTITIQQDRLSAVKQFAEFCEGVIVLKGAGTLIAQKNELTAVSPFTTPNLAVAGSGDVLAGVIGSLQARGLPPREAACLAVYEHGLAGDLLAEDFPARGNTASEIADAIPKARKELMTC